jgi:hypothetical protein
VRGEITKCFLLVRITSKVVSNNESEKNKTKKNTFEKSYKPYLNIGFVVPIAATMNGWFFWVVTKCCFGTPDVSEQYIVPTFSDEELVRQEKKTWQTAGTAFRMKYDVSEKHIAFILRAGKKPAYLLYVSYFLLDSEDGSKKFPRNVGLFPN